MVFLQELNPFQGSICKRPIQDIMKKTNEW